MYRIGIDIGSSYTKFCVMDDADAILELDCGRTPIRQKKYFEKALLSLSAKYPALQVISCGYGKRNISAIKNINELTALARGVEYMSSGSETVLDIGGQDMKIIRQRGGNLREFFVNDKCAAGSGMFLQNACGLLEMDFDKISLTHAPKPCVQLSSVCAVFAQSEIIELLADNVEAEQIIHAVIWQILTQAKKLVGKLNCKDILLTGGLTRIPGIERFAEACLGKKVRICQNASYLSAIGAALI